MNLYIAHVGFYDDLIGIYELHSNIFVVAEDVKSAKELVKKKEIFIEKKMHIDGIQEISCVDGYEILVGQSNRNLIDKKFSYGDVKVL